MLDIYFLLFLFLKKVSKMHAQPISLSTVLSLKSYCQSIELIEKNGRERIDARYLFSFLFLKKVSKMHAISLFTVSSLKSHCQSIELIKKNGRKRIEIRYLFSFSFFEKSVKDARATGYTFIVGTTRVATLTL